PNVARGPYTVHVVNDTTWLAAELAADLPDPWHPIRVLESSGRERLLPRPPPGYGNVAPMQFSTDGQRLAVVRAWHGHSVGICDVSTGRQIAHLTWDGSNLNDLTFSADGRRLAVASDSPVVSVWDTDTGRRVAELRTPTARVMAVAFHP